ncbi:MAG: hypothetical protein ABI417_11715 [Coleofasciculaceae cyanobacterium]
MIASGKALPDTSWILTKLSYVMDNFISGFVCGFGIGFFFAAIIAVILGVLSVLSLTMDASDLPRRNSPRVVANRRRRFVD